MYSNTYYIIQKYLYIH